MPKNQTVRLTHPRPPTLWLKFLAMVITAAALPAQSVARPGNQTGAELPRIEAKAAIVINRKTGAVLGSKKCQPAPPHGKYNKDHDGSNDAGSD